jgi:hypothetical protein
MVGKLSLIVGTKDTVDRPLSGRTATAVTTDTKHEADALIQEDGRITTSELCAATGIGNWRLWPSSEKLATENFAQGWRRNWSPLNTKQPEILLCSAKDGDYFNISIFCVLNHIKIHK